MSRNVTKQVELIPGTNRDVSKSQWFTPPKLAARVVEWAADGVRGAYYPDALRVLEPSAGNGALVRPLVAAGADVCAVEIDVRLCPELHLLEPMHVERADFLSLQPHSIGRFDLCVMNPPYEGNQDVRFIQHALNFAPRVVAILRADIWYTRQRYETLWKSVRPTRAAFCVGRPFKGAETDFCVVELERRAHCANGCEVMVEWWADSWF